MLICSVQFAAPTNTGAQLLSRDIMNNIIIKVTLRNKRIQVLKMLVSDVRCSCQSVMIKDTNFKMSRHVAGRGSGGPDPSEILNFI